MIALSKFFMRSLMAALLLLTLFIQTDAVAQATRASVSAPPDALRPPPPDEDPPYNNAAFVSQSVPTTMTAGAVYTVTVNMVNNGTTTWNSALSYNLGSRNPYDNFTWGGARVAVAGSIPPGVTAQFTFNVTAPSTAGSYNFQWAMVQDGVEWFGPTSDNVVVNVVAPPRVNNAAIVSQNVPAQMVAGQSYPVTIVMQNTGNTTWASADQYSLGVPGGRAALSGSVPPGGQANFSFYFTAPPPGNYSFLTQMVQDGVEWFGAVLNSPYSVSAPPSNGAQFVSQNVPATMVPGQVYSVTVVMQNTGGTTWTAGESYRLGSSNPLGNGTWTTTRVELPSAVAPGQTATFNFAVTAPSTPGSYTFEWHMLREMVEWFGAPSQTVAVQVALQGDTVTYIHTDGLGSPVARSDSAGNVVARTAYEPYGRTALGTTPSIGFTGHVNDADTGLVYMQQRYYDPVAGRFLSVDPVVTDTNTGASFNRYAYANNSPYKYIDPDGRDARDDQIASDLAKAQANFCNGQCSGGVGAGRGLANALGLTNYDQNASNFHSYFHSTDLCETKYKGCTTEYAAQGQMYSAAPGQKGAISPGSSRILGILGGNHIFQFADKSKAIVVNITMGDHILKDGFVVRWVGEKNGVVSINTYGEGVNTSAYTRILNQAAGYVFKYSDWNIREQMKLKIRETPQ